jgi:hypothetical protein
MKIDGKWLFFQLKIAVNGYFFVKKIENLG